MARSSDIPSSSQAMKMFVLGAVILCMFTVIAVVLVALLIPAPENASIITIIVGITTPTILALLSAGLHGMGGAIDGKMSRLLDATAQNEHAQGLVEGLRENPRTNLDPRR